MRRGRWSTWLLLTLLLATASVAVAYYLDNSRYDEWRLVTRAQDSLPWSRFEWEGDSSGSRYLDRAALFVPLRIAGVDKPLTFQLDLGSQLSMLYGNTLSVLDDPKLRATKMKSLVYFWDRHTSIKNVTIDAGTFSLVNSDMYVMQDQGTSQLEDTVHIGTLGSDAFRGKMLLIDYPHERWCVLDTMSVAMQAHYTFTAMRIDEYGRPTVPVTIADKTYYALFDTGSSFFPIIASSEVVAQLSGIETDTVETFAWGKPITLIGKEVTDPIAVAGMFISKATVYRRSEGQKEAAILGNALFWDRVIALDFKHRRFGIQHSDQ